MDTSGVDRRTVERAIREHPLVPQLLEAIRFAAKEDDDLLLRFLRDLLTHKEIEEIAKRWAAAQRLLADQKQAVVARDLLMSFATIRTVMRCLVGSTVTGGYEDVYTRVRDSTEGVR